MRSLRSLLLVPLFLAASGSAIRGQSLDAAYQTQAWSDEETRRLHGGLLRLSRGLGVEVALELSRAGWSETGSTCGGFVPEPGACVVEPLDAIAEAFALSVGFSPVNPRLLGGTLQLPVSVGVGGVRLEKRGTETGGRKEDGQGLFEVGLGVRYRSARFWDNRLGVFLEYRAVAGLELSLGDCLDCHDPLRGGATRQAFGVGITVGG